MDPYLERPTEWRHFHQAFIAAVSDELNRTLPPGFVSRVEQRVYTQPGNPGFTPAGTVRSGAPSSAGVALVTPPVLFRVEREKIHESFIRVVDVLTVEHVVTVLGVVSPANKTPGGRGRDGYVRERDSLLDSGSHLLELDLLRGGAHTVALERSLIAAEKPFDYVACLHRAGNGRQRFECWPFGVREEMPRILIPLTPDLPDLAFDLRVLLDRVYEDGAFQRSIDYSREPEPPFSASDAAWADALLREKGLRGGVG
jgi:hypothetical protein